jgi:transposase-like protein
MLVTFSSAKSLMSKVVKECPTDPVEFLIGKLQAIQRQRRKVSHIHDYYASLL